MLLMKTSAITRKIVSSILFLSLIFSISACAKKKPQFQELSTTVLSPYDEHQVDVSVKVIGNRKIEVTLTNNSQTTSYTYGKPYQLEFKEDGKWYKVPFQEIMWTMEAHLLGHGEKSEIDGKEFYMSNTGELTWYLDDMHGDLPAGHYRYVTKITSESAMNREFQIAGEFDLEKATNEPDPLKKSSIDPSQITSQQERSIPVEELSYNKQDGYCLLIIVRQSTASKEYKVERQKDGEWYEIPVKGEGGTYEADSPTQQINLYMEQDLVSGHYRLIRDDLYYLVQEENAPGRYTVYEFDI